MNDSLLEFAGRIDLIKRNLDVMAVSLESATALLSILMTELQLQPPNTQPFGRQPPPEPNFVQDFMAHHTSNGTQRKSHHKQPKQITNGREHMPGHMIMEMIQAHPERSFSQEAVSMFLKRRGIVLTADQVRKLTANLVQNKRIVPVGTNMWSLAPTVPRVESTPPKRHSGRNRKMTRAEKDKLSQVQRDKYANLTAEERAARNKKLLDGRMKSIRKQKRERQALQRQAEQTGQVAAAG